MSVTDVESRAARTRYPGPRAGRRAALLPDPAGRRRLPTRCPPPPGTAARTAVWQDLAEDLTCLVHGGRIAAARTELARLDEAGLRDLVITLAAMRRPRWIRDGDDVDEVTVTQALEGAPVRLTRPERAAAARAIIDRGGGITELSAGLHMNGATARAVYEQNVVAAPEKLAAARAIIGRGGGTIELSAGLHVSASIAAVVYEKITGLAATAGRQEAEARAVLDQGGTPADVAIVLAISQADARKLCAAAAEPPSARRARRPMRRLPERRKPR